MSIYSSKSISSVNLIQIGTQFKHLFILMDCFYWFGRVVWCLFSFMLLDEKTDMLISVCKKNNMLPSSVIRCCCFVIALCILSWCNYIKTLHTVCFYETPKRTLCVWMKGEWPWKSLHTHVFINKHLFLNVCLTFIHKCSCPTLDHDNLVWGTKTMGSPHFPLCPIHHSHSCDLHMDLCILPWK